MSIATRTGDGGITGLMYNRRVSKCHPRVEAYGTVDELNAALGLARASATELLIRDNLLWIQKDLVTLMGELATSVDDLPRYVADGHQLVTPDLTAKLDRLLRDVESRQLSFHGWATPGANPTAAALDFARTVCRRAERRVCALDDQDQLQNAQIIIHLNRLADLLWLLARWCEAPHARPPDAASEHEGGASVPASRRDPCTRPLHPDAKGALPARQEPRPTLLQAEQAGGVRLRVTPD